MIAQSDQSETGEVPAFDQGAGDGSTESRPTDGVERIGSTESRPTDGVERAGSTESRPTEGAGRARGWSRWALGVVALLVSRLEGGVPGGQVYEATSAYHHIRVLDQQGRRTLLFNRSEETRMSLQNPLQGHFQYVEYFFMPCVWNPEMTNVLMIGLGGGSTQRLYHEYCPKVTIYSVEVDSVVRQVAQGYFHLKEGPRQRVFIEDGRQFLRRNPAVYGAILLDAYTEGRYGASLPHHLTTQEFFTLARDRLEPEGVLAYNVMGSLSGWRADIVGSLYRTLKVVFPQVYLFPASESQNVVLVATRTAEPATLGWLTSRARSAYQSGKVLLPTLGTRLAAFRAEPPPNVERCPVLTDDFAPVDGLLSEGRSL